MEGSWGLGDVVGGGGQGFVRCLGLYCAPRVHSAS